MRWFARISLHQQIILVGALACALGVVGISFGHWLSTRHFVREQLASQAQETATALAMTLPAALVTGDEGLVKTMLMPSMDRGYFRHLTVRDTNNHVLVSVGATTPQVSGVPPWFSSLVSLDAPAAEALLSAGWQQLGHIEVASDPALALRRLWLDMLQTLMWMGFVYALITALLVMWLRQVLAPLLAVEQAAISVVEHRYKRIPELAEAPELKRFIRAFNGLVSTVNEQLDIEEQRTEHFRQRVLLDTLTGLPNRVALNAWLAAQPVMLDRWLGLIEIEGVAELTKTQGYATGDILVLAIANALKDMQMSGDYIARIGPVSFVIVHRGHGEAGIRLVAERLMGSISAGLRRYNSRGLCSSGGWVPCVSIGEAGQVLALADRAAALARGHGSGHVGILVEDTAPAELCGIGSQGWLNWVQQAVQSGNYSLAMQEIVSVGRQEPVQREVFLRLHGEDGKAISAMAFMPLVLRAGETDLLDRTMIRLLHNALVAGHIQCDQVAANLSAVSWRSEKFGRWLLEMLQDWPPTAQPVFELRDVDVAEDMDRAAHFAQSLREVGADVAIDHFGIAAGGIASLRRVMPRYLKLDASLITGLDEDERKFHVESLIRVADTLNIPVWAQLFGSHTSYEVLTGLGVSAVQGNLVSPETPVPQN